MQVTTYNNNAAVAQLISRALADAMDFIATANAEVALDGGQVTEDGLTCLNMQIQLAFATLEQAAKLAEQLKVPE